MKDEDLSILLANTVLVGPAGEDSDGSEDADKK